MYYCCGITDKGIMPHNEDSFLINRYVTNEGAFEQKLSEPFITAVSDGVSNENSGEIASKLCLEFLEDIGYKEGFSLQSNLIDVHKRLMEYGYENENCRNMQATLCGIFIDKDENVLSFNVGDSRLYLFREGSTRQITTDQSLVQLMYQQGELSFEELKSHKRRNIIFPAFGNLTSEPQIDISRISGGLTYGDILLLCTDGLSDYTSISEIQDILELPKSLPTRLEMLVKKAIEKGSKDNITAVAVIYCEN